MCPNIHTNDGKKSMITLGNSFGIEADEINKTFRVRLVIKLPRSQTLIIHAPVKGIVELNDLITEYKKQGYTPIEEAGGELRSVNR